MDRITPETYCQIEVSIERPLIPKTKREMVEQLFESLSEFVGEMMTPELRYKIKYTISAKLHEWFSQGILPERAWSPALESDDSHIYQELEDYICACWHPRTNTQSPHKVSLQEDDGIQSITVALPSTLRRWLETNPDEEIKNSY